MSQPSISGYPTRAAAPAHPARLAAHAMSHGLSASFTPSFRYLDLGCGDGGHVLPLAAQFPDAELVGVDVNAGAIALGASIGGQAALDNVRLLEGDLRDFQPDGRFDYVCAHGVYSWVAPDLQQRLLSLIASSLTDGGVAYVSYNTFPGWGVRGVVRDMMLHAGRPGDDDAARLRRAKSAVTRLARMLAERQDPYAQLLRAELALLDNKDDGYLLGEYLAPINEALHVRDFLARAAEHGLAFLAESLPATPDGALELTTPWELMGAGLSRAEAEQYLDVASYRQLRGTLLRHDGAAASDKPDLGALGDSGFFAADLRLETAEPLLGPGKPLGFVAATSAVIQAERPLLKAALLCLAEAWPRGLRSAELVGRAIAALRERGLESIVADGEVDAMLAELGALVQRRLIELLPWTPGAEKRMPAKPRIGRLSRLEAERRACITTPRHETLPLDPFSRVVVQICDGERDMDGLLRELEVWRDAGELAADTDWNERALAQSLRQALLRLAALGVLDG